MRRRRGALGCLEAEAEVIEGSFRAAVWSMVGYKEVEIGDMPPMARASDEEIRRMMESGMVSD
jgi:hypothetical protein